MHKVQKSFSTCCTLSTGYVQCVHGSCFRWKNMRVSFSYLLCGTRIAASLSCYCVCKRTIW